MPQKRLIIFMPSINGGGVEKNFFIISEYFSKKIDDISVITISKKFKNKINKKIKIISPKYNFWDNLGRRKKFIVSIFLLFIEILKDRRLTVFCLQGNIYCTLLCKLLGIKVIVRYNSAPEGWSSNVFKLYPFFFKSLASKFKNFNVLKLSLS